MYYVPAHWFSHHTEQEGSRGGGGISAWNKKIMLVKASGGHNELLAKEQNVKGKGQIPTAKTQDHKNSWMNRQKWSAAQGAKYTRKGRK